MRSRLTATLITAAVVLANLAFVALGAVFDYPDVLNQPTDDVLARFAADRAEISTWFTVLALSAGLLAPTAILLGRTATGRAMRLAVPVGVAAAAAQVVGLLRWPLLVPGIGAEDFDRVDLVLGVLLGETLGYTLTAAWTVLVVTALAPSLPRWLVVVGWVTAGLIMAGTLVPLGVPGADSANFVGYVAWSLWLLVLAWQLWTGRLGGVTDTSRPVHAPATADR